MPIFQPGGDNTGYRAPAKTLTIKALQDRQKALAASQDAAAANAAPITNMWQGAGALVNQLGDSMQMSRAASQESDARAQLAQIMSGIDPNKGASMEQIAAMQQLDPEFANKEYERAMTERAAAAAREDEQSFRAGESQADRDARIAEQQAGFTHDDTTAATKVSTDKDLKTYQDRIDDQNAKDAAAVAAKAAQQAAANQTPEAQDAAAVAAGSMTPETAAANAKARRAKADADAANTARSANDPYTSTGDAVADEKAGAYGVPGSPESLARMEAEIKSGNLKGTPAGTSSKMREEWAKVETKMWGDYQTEGTKAATLKNQMDMLDALGTTPQGPLIGRLAEMFPGFSDNAAAFQSIVLNAAPKQRAEGSGSTSDIEYDGMLKALPKLINNPEANRLIAQMVRSQAQLSIERAAIVNEWSRSDGVPDADNLARAKLAELDKRSVMDDKLKAMIAAVNGEAPAADPAAAAGGGADPNDPLGMRPKK
jgi:hypothetical protein